MGFARLLYSLVHAAGVGGSGGKCGVVAAPARMAEGHQTGGGGASRGVSRHVQVGHAPWVPWEGAALKELEGTGWPDHGAAPSPGTRVPGTMKTWAGPALHYTSSPIYI